jgi:hypothetical protein
MKMTRTKSSKKSKKSISRPKLRFHQKHLYKKKFEWKPKVSFEIKNWATLGITCPLF